MVLRNFLTSGSLFKRHPGQDTISPVIADTRAITTATNASSRKASILIRKGKIGPNGEGMKADQCPKKIQAAQFEDNQDKKRLSNTDSTV